MNRIQKNKTELLILSVLSICIMMLQYFQIHGQAIFFLDNDDYIRVQRIREFFTHHDWNNSIIIRGNYPYGISLHWTRFYDLFLIIPSYLLSFFTQSIDRSLEYVCFWISPILRVISSVIVLKIATNIMPKKSAFLTAVLFTSIPFISGYFAFGRPDHHAFMVLWILIYISSLIELISQQKFPSIISHLKTATTAAICIWISPETLITILASLGCLFFCAFNNIQRLKTLYLISLITSLFVGLIAFIPEQASNTSFLLLICSLWTLELLRK